MAYKPILFKTEMVQAIQTGFKTQTRRIIKDNSVCRPFNPGDILWVRETWSTTEKCGLYPNWPTSGVHYMHKAVDPDCEPAKEARWFPSIHMPKEAARIFLRVKDVRVERLRNMGYSDVAAEGFGSWESFINLWDSTIKPADLNKYGWNADPWVWVIEFERCEKPEDFGQAIPEGGRPGHEEGTSMA